MSPVGAQYDIQLGGKGYMLPRSEYKGRAWQRTGQPDTPSRRSAADAKYGVVEDTLDHPEVWDDWSGGFGQAYRRAGENTYHWAENFDARFPRQLVHAQAPQIPANIIGSPLLGVGQVWDLPTWRDGQVPGNGAVAVMMPNAVAWLNPSDDTASPFLAGYLGIDGTGSRALAAGRPATWGSWNYFPLLGNNYILSAETGCTVSAFFATCEAQNFLAAGGRLWRSFGVHGEWGTGWGHYLSSISALSRNAVASVALGNWSATLSVGNNFHGIREMVAFNDQIFCGLADGLYAGDQSGSFVNVLANLAEYQHQDNCRSLTVHEGAVIAAHTTGLYAYKPGFPEAQVQEIGPSSLQSDKSPLRGYTRAVTSHGPWLLAGLYTGSQSYIVAGRDVGDKYLWHTLNRLPGVVKVNHLHIDGITVASSGVKIPNRLWASSAASIDTGGTCPLYYYPIPTLFGNPLAPSTAFSPNYCGSARMDLGSVDWNAPSTAKVFRAVDIWAENLASAAQWANVYYTLDGGTRTLLGTTAKSPKDTLYFPSSVGSFTTGQSIALSLESFTGSYGVTPIYRAVVLRGALRPKSIDEITAVVRIADGVRDRQGTPLRPGAVMLDELRALAVAAAPTTLVDLAGATQQVVVLAPIEEQEIYQTGEQNPEIAAKVRLAVLAFTGG